MDKFIMKVSDNTNAIIFLALILVEYQPIWKEIHHNTNNYWKI